MSRNRNISAVSQAQFIQAVALYSAGRLDEAEPLLAKVLREQARHFDALHLLGLIALQTNRAEKAVELIRKAVAVNPAVANAHLNLGSALLACHRPREAIASYDRAIALQHANPEAYNNRGNALRALGQHEAALASYDRALAFKPDYSAAHYNRGIVLADLAHWDDAIAAYRDAIVLQPDYAEAYNNLGIALLAQNRASEALASLDHALALRPDDTAAHRNRGRALHALGSLDEALASYDRAIALSPGHAAAHHDRGGTLRDLGQFEAARVSYGRAVALRPDTGFLVALGNILRDLGHADDAIAAYDRALVLDPDDAVSHYNRGVVLRETERYSEALASLDRALARKPDYAEAHYNRGIALRELGRENEAIQAFAAAIAFDPAIEHCAGDKLLLQMTLCDWDGVDRDLALIAERIEAGQQASTPFPMAVLSNDPALQRKAATLYAPRGHPLGAEAKNGQLAGGRLRVGYFSADFQEHATANLMAELFERHDRSVFEVFAFSFGADTGGGMRQRLGAAFDRFLDVRSRSPAEIARQARDLGLDIAVDLKGYTRAARPSIFAHRAAPIQVSYLGYPGTTGADYIDYLMADRVVVPPSYQTHYTEKIVYLPPSYQVNDRRRAISDCTPSREAAGLPATGFVFCCFNNSYKISPGTFACWMRILHRVEGSVLWLLPHSESAAQNLTRAAARDGIGEHRLVFARKQALADHLARHRLADLFLDTWPCNAHTTASDALWAGLPVLTWLGETFAGRVAASLLTAVGLPELVAKTRTEYELLAIALALDRGRLAGIKQGLVERRRTAPLFDAALSARHIEAAYRAMHARHQAGLPPDHLDIF